MPPISRTQCLIHPQFPYQRIRIQVCSAETQLMFPYLQINKRFHLRTWMQRYLNLPLIRPDAVF